MSNWFESNATKSVIIYTLVVMGATWAAFEFVFDKNKINFYEAKVGRAEAEAKEVNARNSVLGTRVEYLTIENQKLTKWLESTPQSIPYYEKEINLLKGKGQKSNSNQAGGAQGETQSYRNESNKLEAATSFFDKKTSAVIGVAKINYGNTASVIVTLPDGQKVREENAAAGDNWRFKKSAESTC